MQRAVTVQNFTSAAESLISLSRESPTEAPEYVSTLLKLGGRYLGIMGIEFCPRHDYKFHCCDFVDPFIDDG